MLCVRTAVLPAVEQAAAIICCKLTVNLQLWPCKGLWQYFQRARIGRACKFASFPVPLFGIPCTLILTCVIVRISSKRSSWCGCFCEAHDSGLRQRVQRDSLKRLTKSHSTVKSACRRVGCRLAEACRTGLCRVPQLHVFALSKAAVAALPFRLAVAVALEVSCCIAR